MSSSVYEKLCVLFNIGAQSAEVAALQQYDQDEGLKVAIQMFQLAAGAFSYIRDNSLTTTRSDCTTDLNHETLSLLISIMLAQTQEVFYHKAVKDKKKGITISKLAAQCSDYYADAMKQIQTESLKDLQKVWLGTLAGKQALLHGLSEYHKAEHENTENKNIGEALARLTRSVELLKVADSRAGKDVPVKQSLNLVQNSYEKAKKENEYVYHERVPDYKSLANLERVSLAAAKQIKFPLSEDFRDLFSTMVPVAVNNGLQMFKSRKMETFNLEIGKLRQATELLNA